MLDAVSRYSEWELLSLLTWIGEQQRKEPVEPGVTLCFEIDLRSKQERGEAKPSEEQTEEQNEMSYMDYAFLLTLMDEPSKGFLAWLLLMSLYGKVGPRNHDPALPAALNQ